MKIIATTVALSAVAAAAATAAQPPVAKTPGLVVAHGGRIHVEGRAVALGTQPAWSPDGRRIAFVRDGHVLVADRNGRNQRRLTPPASGGHRPANAPAWSPDGTRIAFSGARDVYAVTVATRRLTRLTRSAEPWRGNYTPAYSPDGRTIALSRATSEFNSDIFLMNADGSNLRRLTRTDGTHDDLGEETMPAWTPDGRRLVYVSNRDGNWELYAIDRSGRNERRLTRTPLTTEERPRVHPDGARVLYVHESRVAWLRLSGPGVRELGAGTAADWR